MLLFDGSFLLPFVVVEMSLGTIFVSDRIRSFPPLVVINKFKLDVESSTQQDPRYAEHFPLGKIPCFIGPNGDLVLHEVIAITIYLVQAGDGERSALLGRLKEEHAEILKWMSFTNLDVLTAIDAFKPLVGMLPYDKKKVDGDLQWLGRYAQVYEAQLSKSLYLVGDTFTIADLFCAVILSKAFEYFFDSSWRLDHPFVSRWFTKVMEDPDVVKVMGNFKWVDKKYENVPPKI